MLAAKVRKGISLCFCKWYRAVEREAAGSSGLGRWIWNLEVPGSNPPPYYYLDYCGSNKSWNKYHLRQVVTWRQIYHLTVACSGRMTEFRLQSRYQLTIITSRKNSFRLFPRLWWSWFHYFTFQDGRSHTAFLRQPQLSFILRAFYIVSKYLATRKCF